MPTLLEVSYVCFVVIRDSWQLAAHLVSILQFFQAESLKLNNVIKSLGK